MSDLNPTANLFVMIKGIKNYPILWQGKANQELDRSISGPIWDRIAEQCGSTLSTDDLQEMWGHMLETYYCLVRRQILFNDFTVNKWAFFEPMSFFYCMTVAKILVSEALNDNVESSISSVESTPKPVAPMQEQPDVSGENEVSSTTTQLCDGPSTSAQSRAAAANPPKAGKPETFQALFIECIHQLPMLWSSRKFPEFLQHNTIAEEFRYRKCLESAVWKELAAYFGAPPRLLLSEWSIIKERYVDELEKEQLAEGTLHGFKSMWVYFERMSFMRETLMNNVRKRQRLRNMDANDTHFQKILHDLQEEREYQMQQQQTPVEPATPMINQEMDAVWEYFSHTEQK